MENEAVHWPLYVHQLCIERHLFLCLTHLVEEQVEVYPPPGRLHVARLLSCCLAAILPDLLEL
ncbi:MAG: hypothetical protein IKH26_00580 [Bacteroidaceae bacterium]|nr:hypothetical protein [Bacteroidaceae bacterium]